MSDKQIIVGSFQDDTLNGHDGVDEILGLDGDDTLIGGSGNDTLIGGAGDDTLDGGAGDDILDAGIGDDVLAGGAGNDTIIQSGSGKQYYDGGDGIDTYVLKLSNWTTFPEDFIGEVNLLTDFSGAHLDPTNPLNDTVVNIENITLEGDIDFIMTGDDGANIIITDGGDDVISGGAGNDTLDGGAGSNLLEGGSGDDIYRYAYLGADIISDSGGSNDILYITTRDDEGKKYWSGDSYVENGNLIIVSRRDETKTLTIENAFSADGRIEKIIFHAADGSYADFEVRIASLADNLSGEYISYFGSASDDTLVMNDGYNEAALGDGNDTVTIGNGGGFVFLGKGQDIAYGSDANDWIFGDEDDDTLVGGAGDDQLYGGAGHDLIDAGAGDDHLDGGDGEDSADYSGSPSAVHIDAQLGVADDGYGSQDTLYSIEGFGGSAFDDTLLGSDTDPYSPIEGNAAWRSVDNYEMFRGNQGDDYIDGRGGYDEISYTNSPIGLTIDLRQRYQDDGFGTTDEIHNIEGVEATAHDDIVYGNQFDNSLDGRAGNNTIDGGDGYDFVEYNGSGRDNVVVDLALGTATFKKSGSNTVFTDTLFNIEGVIGSANDDKISGDNSANRLFGTRGNDLIYGRAGNDVIRGGADDDTIYGESGDDTLIGGSGDDKLYGGAGDDTIIQNGSGTQHYDGGDGIDTYVLQLSEIHINAIFPDGFIGEVNLITGFSGAHLDPTNPLNDTVVNIENITLKGDIDFIMTGDDGDNIIITDGGDDIIYGGDGDDIIRGGAGNDILYTGSGEDFLYGEGGDDTLVISGSGISTLNGGAGSDTFRLDLANYTPNIENFVLEINLTTGKSGGLGTQTPLTDKLISIENIEYIGPYKSELTGNELANFIWGGDGDDIIRGGAGNDTLDSGAGDDEVYGGEGDDTIIQSGSGTQHYDGGVGTDTYIINLRDWETPFADDFIAEVNLTTGFSGVYLDPSHSLNDTVVNIENITLWGDIHFRATGDGGDNVIISDGGDDIINGGAGNDTIDSGAGDDEIYGGDGDDTLIQSGSGRHYYDGGDGIDTYVLQISNWTTYPDGFIGEVDLITGFSGAHFEPTNPLNDTVVDIENITLEGDIDFIMTGDDADNIIITDGGDDVISGGSGNDILDGGDGDNILNGGDGDDILHAAAGYNRLFGDAGNDRFEWSGGDAYIDGGDGTDVLQLGGNFTDYEVIYTLSNTIQFRQKTTNDVLEINDIESIRFNYDNDALTGAYRWSAQTVIPGESYVFSTGDSGFSVDTGDVSGNLDWLTVTSEGFSGIVPADYKGWGWQYFAYIVPSDPNSSLQGAYDELNLVNAWELADWGEPKIIVSPEIAPHIKYDVAVHFNSSNQTINFGDQTIAANSIRMGDGRTYALETFESARGDNGILARGTEFDDYYNLSGYTANDFGDLKYVADFELSIGNDVYIAPDLSRNNRYIGELDARHYFDRAPGDLDTSSGLYFEFLGDGAVKMHDFANGHMTTGYNIGTIFTSAVSNDVVVGDGSDNFLSSQGGHDTFYGGDGYDYFKIRYRDYDNISERKITISDYEVNEKVEITDFGFTSDFEDEFSITYDEVLGKTKIGVQTLLIDTAALVEIEGNWQLASAPILEANRHLKFEFEEATDPSAFTIAKISRSGDEVVFGLYVDPTQDPGGDGIGSFGLTFDYDPSVLSIDESKITYTQLNGFVGQTGAHNTIDGEIEMGGFSFPDLTDFTSPMIEITATVLDLNQPLELRVTSTMFDDQMVPDTSAIFELGARELSGTVLTRGGGMISDVSVTGDVIGTDEDLYATSSDQGSFILEVDDGIDLTVYGELEHVNASPTKAITPQDALEALRLSVGLSITSGSKDAFDYMAADFNQNGSVTPQDALEILKYAVGLRNLEAEWKFIDGNGDYSDIGKSNTVFEEGVGVEAVSANLEVTMTGILLGDVNDTYTTYLEVM